MKVKLEFRCCHTQRRPGMRAHARRARGRHGQLRSLLHPGGRLRVVEGGGVNARSREEV